MQQVVGEACQHSLFQALCDQVLNCDYPLCVLALKICRPRIDIAFADCDCSDSGASDRDIGVSVGCINSNARSMVPGNAIEWTQPDGDIAWGANDPFGGLTLPSDLFNVLRVEGSVQTFNPYHTTRRRCIRS